jgi:AcrR family transcriptional regulator
MDIGSRTTGADAFRDSEDSGSLSTRGNNRKALQDNTSGIGGGLRKSAGERREAVLKAAVAEFAALGLHGGSTERIAGCVGISQPYVFKLFGNKKDLFLAATGYAYDRVAAVFREAAESDPKNPLKTMGVAYEQLLLPNREEMLMILQSFTASADEEIRQTVSRRYAALRRFIQQISGASDDEVDAFLAEGMRLTITAAIEPTESMEKSTGAEQAGREE